MPGVRHTLKQFLMRLGRPALAELSARSESQARSLAAIEEQLRRIEATVDSLAGATFSLEKYREELGFWRWLITTEEGRGSLPAPFEVVFGAWQRDRLRELARWLGLGEGDGLDPALDAALDRWCAERCAIEIGAGPYPCLAAAPRWRRAVAIDPLARGYAEEGLIPATASHVVYIEAPGERLPLPSASADLVILENALDHVSDPGAVLAEARRVLRADGLLWVLVDLSTYTDHMHPHAFDERSIKGLLARCGFESVRDRVSDHKSHPQAFGEYRGLLRPTPGAIPSTASRAIAYPAASAGSSP